MQNTGSSIRCDATTRFVQVDQMLTRVAIREEEAQVCPEEAQLLAAENEANSSTQLAIRMRRASACALGLLLLLAAAMYSGLLPSRHSNAPALGAPLPSEWIPERKVSHTGEALALTEEKKRDLPRLVWAFWFGAPMDGARLVSFQNMTEGLGIPVRLVTLKNLHNYNLSDSPIHPAFHLLTDIHKADYLRAYFMHHYGGGYHDVKHAPPTSSAIWPKFFDKFHTDSNIWLAGGTYGSYACGEENFETGWCDRLHSQHEKCCPELQSNISQLKVHIPDVQAFIARPKTPLTATWIRLLHAKLDKAYPALKKHPGPPGRCCMVWHHHSNSYPFIWPEICGEITTPTFAKYQDHIIMGLPSVTGEFYVGSER